MMKIGFIFECGPEGPDVQVCRHLVHKLDPSIQFIPSTLDNKKKLVEECGPVAKTLLGECEKVIVVWDLYPAWREKGIKPCRYEDRQSIFQSLQSEDVDLSRIFLVCIREELEAWREKGIKPCRYEDRQSIFQSLQSEDVDLSRIFLVCIREELEAWLLADHRSVTAMLKPLKHPHPVSRISRFSTPDSINNPKKRLTKIFTQELGPRRRYVDYLHAILIAEKISDFTKLRHSLSFQRFALKVAGREL